MEDSQTITFLKFAVVTVLLEMTKHLETVITEAYLNGEATYVLDGQLINGKALGTIANSLAGWEEAEKINIGIDLQLWDNMVDISADIFRENRNDLLVSGIPVSGIFGTGAPGSGSPTINAGSTRNEGIEFSVKYNKVVNDKLDFNISL